MSVDKNSMLLYAVTDRTWLGENNLSKQAEEAVLAGATFVQLREKNIEFDEFVEIAKEIKAVTDKYKIPFVINDDVDAAIEINADGVHIGQSDEGLVSARKKLGGSKIIGVSAHNLDEAITAEKNGADYLGVGAVFSTSTKSNANTVSFDTLKKICESVSIPVVAIGGINADNILELRGCGIAGVAVVSAIFAQKNIANATRELFALAKQVTVKL